MKCTQPVCSSGWVLSSPYHHFRDFVEGVPSVLQSEYRPSAGEDERHHLVDYINACSTKIPKEGYKDQVYRAIFFTILQYGSETWDTYFHYLRSFEQFQLRCLPPSLTFTRVTSSPILKSLKRQRSPVSRPSNWTLSYAGLDTFSQWGIIACPELYCAASSPQAIETEGYQRNDSRTSWTNPFVPVTSIMVCPSWERDHQTSQHQLCCLLLWK